MSFFEQAKKQFSSGGRLLLAFTILFLSVAPAQKQKEKERPDVFSSVPAHLRTQLDARLRLFIEYNKSKQWEKAYEMIGEQYRQAVGDGLTLEAYLKDHKTRRLLKFTPTTIYEVKINDNDGWWSINGCGLWVWDSKENLETGLEAYRQDNDWYFSDPAPDSPCIHCPIKTCRHKNRK